jgi:D-tyrosyl-tRNA(Tyr) deacylase
VRAVVQRVSQASVEVEGTEIARIGPGLLVLLGVAPTDGEEQARRLADKLVNLRMFEDEQGKTNLAALDVGAEVLVVSQFTLYADTSRGRRPSFIYAAGPDLAAPLVERFAWMIAERGLRVATGQFGAFMRVALCNEGPFTLVLDVD